MFNHDAFARDDAATDQLALAEAACPGAVSFGACAHCGARDFLIEDPEGGERFCVSRCAAALVVAVQAGVFGEIAS